MRFLFVLLLSISGLPVSADDITAALEGAWRVDLRPTPDAPAYYQEFVAELDDDGALSGSFYGTAFDGGHWDATWDTLYFAFETEDARTSYHHSGRVVADRLEGLTHAPERNFLLRWTAERPPEATGSRPD